MNLQKIILVLPVLLTVVIITSCLKKPEDIKYNDDECAYCSMQIGDNKFAAEIISDEEKVYKFDSIECLTGFALVKDFINDNSQTFYVMDYLKPGNFINARSSFFSGNKNFRSPMGLNVQAFATETERDMFLKQNGGNKLSWDEVVKTIKDSEN